MLRIKYAPLRRPEKSPASASVQGNAEFPAVAKQMRRPSDPCASAARQDVLVAADLDAPSEGENDFDAQAAHRKPNKKGREKEREDGDATEKEREDADATERLQEMVRL